VVISDYITPVMYTDPSGEFPILLLLGSLFIGGLIGGISSAMNMDSDDKFWATFGGGFVNGALTTLSVTFGLAVGGVPGVIFAAAGGLGSGILGSVLTDKFSGRSVDIESMWLSGIYSASIAGVLTAALIYTGLYAAETFISRLTIAASPDTIAIAVGVLIGQPVPKIDKQGKIGSIIYFDYLGVLN